MDNSILKDVKEICNVPEWDDGFDRQLIIHINTALMALAQLGVGPPGGLLITSAENTWSELVEGSVELEGVKTYVGLKVRLIFDPPTSSFVLESYNNTIEELGWRLNLQHEGAFDE